MGAAHSDPWVVLHMRHHLSCKGLLGLLILINNGSQDLIQNKHLLCTFLQSDLALIVITVMRLMTVFW